MLTVVFLLVVPLRGERSSTDADDVNRGAITLYGEHAVQEIKPRLPDLRLFLVETEKEHDEVGECSKMAPTPDIFKPFGTQFAYCPMPSMLIFMDNLGQVTTKKELIKKDHGNRDSGLTPLEFEPTTEDFPCPHVMLQSWFHKFFWVHAGEVPAAPLGGIVFKEKEDAGKQRCRLFKWRLPPREEYSKVATLPEKEITFFLADAEASTGACEELGVVGPAAPLYDPYGPTFAMCASPPMLVFLDEAGNVTRQKKIVLANRQEKMLWKEEKLRFTRVFDVKCQDVMSPSLTFGMTDVEKCIWIHKDVEPATPDGGLECKMKGEDMCRLYNLRDLKMTLVDMDEKLTDTCTVSAPTPAAFRHLGAEFLFCHPQVFVFKDSAGKVTAKKHVQFEHGSSAHKEKPNEKSVNFRLMKRGLTCPAELVNTSHRYFWLHAGTVPHAPDGAFLFKGRNQTTCQLYKMLLHNNLEDMFPLPEQDLDFRLVETMEESSGVCQHLGPPPFALRNLGTKMTFCTMPDMFIFMDAANQETKRVKIVEDTKDYVLKDMILTRIPGDVPCEPKMLSSTFGKTDVKESLWIHKDTVRWAPGGGFLFKVFHEKKCRMYKLIDERVFMSESVNGKPGHCDEVGDVPPEFSDLGNKFSLCLGPRPAREEEPKPMFYFTDSTGHRMFLGRLKFTSENPGNGARPIYLRMVNTNYTCPNLLLNASRYNRMWIHSGIEHEAPDGGMVLRTFFNSRDVDEEGKIGASATCHLLKLVTSTGDELDIYIDDDKNESTAAKPPRCTDYGPSPPALRAYGPQFAFCVSDITTSFSNKRFQFKSATGEVIASKIMTLASPCKQDVVRRKECSAKKLTLMKLEGNFPCQKNMFPLGLAKADIDEVGWVHKGAHGNGGMMVNIRHEEKCRIYIFALHGSKESSNASAHVKKTDSASLRMSVPIWTLSAFIYFAIFHAV